MNGCVLISELALPMTRRLTVLERLEAIRNTWSPGGSPTWVGTIMVLLALVGLVVLGAILIHSYIQRHKKSRAFVDQGLHAGLSKNELKLLRYMVALLSLKNPATIYTAEDLFNQTAARLMRHRRTLAFSAAMRADLYAQVQSMREKLGFRPCSQESSGDLISSRQIAAGARIFITPDGCSEAVGATIVETDDSELVIEADEALPCRSGDDCMIRHSIGAAVWEFESQVVRCEQRKVALNHTHFARLINRRRFPRVRIDKPAHVAKSPFFSENPDQEIPEFIPAKLLQIGGPGLLLQTSLRAQVGERVLITARLATNRLVQGLARIRRQLANKQGGSFLGVELIALDPAEMAELVRQTNLAAVQETRESIALAGAAVQ